MWILPHCFKWRPDQMSLLNHIIVIDRRHDDKECAYNAHTLEPGKHWLLKDMKVTVILGHSFNVTLFVESVLFFNVVFNCLLADDLVCSAHLEEASTSVIFRIPNTFNYCLDLWCLDEIQHFKLNSNLKWIPTRIILLKHHTSQKVLIINRFNIFDNHLFNLVLQQLACITQTKKPFGQQRQKFKHQTHAQQRVGGVREYVVF